MNNNNTDQSSGPLEKINPLRIFPALQTTILIAEQDRHKKQTNLYEVKTYTFPSSWITEEQNSLPQSTNRGHSCIS